MTQREKILSALVGAVLLIVGGVFLFNLLLDAFDGRDTQITNLDSEVTNKQIEYNRLKQSAKRQAEYERRSLSSNVNLARSEYLKWLSDGAQQVEFRRLNVNPGSRRKVGDVYELLTFRLRGHGDLEQVTEFLYHFYNADHLHRIRHLRLVPIQDSKDLDVTMEVEAAALLTAAAKKPLSTQPSGRLNHESLDQYVETIVHRNFFQPPNQSPRIGRMLTQRTVKDDTLRFTPQVEDPDKLDRLQYSLEGEETYGARINERTGEFRWQPRETGEFNFVIRVADDGFPPRIDTQQLRVEVTEKDAGFDFAAFAFVTGIVETRGRRQLWLHVRHTGQILKLSQGDQVDVGSVTGKIMRLDQRHVEIQTKDGQLKVKLGQSLGEAAKNSTNKDVTMTTPM